VTSKEELVITALQQRIGEMSALYETQIAYLRAELTQISNKKQEKIKAEQEYSKLLEEKINEVYND